MLDREGFATAAIHGNKNQNQRDRALKAFRSGAIHVLVATDVAARGIDIPGVGFVYNFDLPNVPENYVHRIGRTARAGREGQAIAFCTAEEMADLRSIERALKAPVDIASGKPWGGSRQAPSGPKKRPRRRPARRPERIAA